VTTEPVYTDEEWGLIVGLPLSVVVAASHVESDSSRATQSESTAGMEAISIGRESASPLVAQVATELLSRAGDPEAGEEPPQISPGDPLAFAADVIARAREAAEILAERAPEEEAEAYRHWLVSIADDVITAAKSGAVLGIGGERVTPAERTFRDDLADTLAM
jgi:hypothetical protein